MPKIPLEAAAEGMPDIDTLFHHICDMAEPIETATAIVRGMRMIAELLDEHESIVMMRLANLALRELDAVEAHRGPCFRLTHPRRAKFEREGWPE